MAEERCRHRLEMVMRTRCREKWMKGEEKKLRHFQLSSPEYKNQTSKKNTLDFCEFHRRLLTGSKSDFQVQPDSMTPL